MLELKGADLYRALIETENGLIVRFDRIDLLLLKNMIHISFYNDSVLVSTQTANDLRLGDTINLHIKGEMSVTLAGLPTVNSEEIELKP